MLSSFLFTKTNESEQNSTDCTTRRPCHLRESTCKGAMVLRDISFLVICAFVGGLGGWVENNAAKGSRLPGFLAPHSDQDIYQRRSDIESNIIDAGFSMTASLYAFLAEHGNVNDILALLNSLVLLICSLYAVKVTLWDGEFTLPFRLLCAQLFRSFCGWFTYLPPSESFLMSVYDIPEIVQCVTGEVNCLDDKEQPFLPFVTFFSGHVATTVIMANFMKKGGGQVATFGLILHFFNIFQIIRLLATRGHYSIDIIIGWLVALYVPGPADNLTHLFTKAFSQSSPPAETRGIEDFSGTTTRMLVNFSSTLFFKSIEFVRTYFGRQSGCDYRSVPTDTTRTGTGAISLGPISPCGEEKAAMKNDMHV